MARTGENIYKRKDGRFEGRYIKAWDEIEKAVYGYVYGNSKAEVREKVRRKKLGEEGPLEAGEPWKELPFREAAERWLAAKHGILAATTIGRYRKELENKLIPEYGDTTMAYITYEEVGRYRSNEGMYGKARGWLLSGAELEAAFDFMVKGGKASDWGFPDKTHFEILSEKKVA